MGTMQLPAQGVTNPEKEAMLSKSLSSLSSKGLSPDTNMCSSPSPVTPLSRIRVDKGHAVQMHDMSEVAKEHFERGVLQEMQERAQSRLAEEDLVETENLADSMHSFSFASPTLRPRSAFGVCPSPQLSQSLNASWQFYNYLGAPVLENVCQTSTRNSNKAVLTINARSSVILVANRTACKMFGYTEEQLCGMKVYDLFTMEERGKQESVLEHHIDSDGNVVLLCGKVLEALGADGRLFMVSVWMKRIQGGQDPRCIVVMEPVQVTKACFTFNAEGVIEDCDINFANLHGLDEAQEAFGISILKFVPGFNHPTPGKSLDKNVRKQRITSRTKDGLPFPALIKIREIDKDFHTLYLERTPPSRVVLSKLLYQGCMWVFANISGLVSVTQDGTVQNCNPTFLRMLFGYSEKDIRHKHITKLIPLLYEHIALLSEGSLPPPAIRQQDPCLDPRRDASCLPNGDTDPEPIGGAPRVGQVNLLQSDLHSLNDNKRSSFSSGLHFGNHIIATPQAMGDSLEHSGVHSADSGIDLQNASPKEGPYVMIESTPAKANHNAPQGTDVIGVSVQTLSARADFELRLYENADVNCPADGVSQSAAPGKAPDFLGTADMLERSRLESPSQTPVRNHSCLSSLVLRRDPSPTCIAKNFYLHAETEAVVVGDAISELAVDLASADTSTPVSDKVREPIAEHGVTDSADKSALGFSFINLLLDDRDEIESVAIAQDLASDGRAGVDVAAFKCREIEKRRSCHEDVAFPPDAPGSISRTAGSPPPDGRVSRLEHARLCEDMNSDLSLSSYAIYDRSVTDVCSAETNRASITEIRESSKSARTSHSAWEIIEPPNVLSTSKNAESRILEGNFYGEAKHADGSLLPISFEIKRIKLKDGSSLFCIWVSRDQDEDADIERAAASQFWARSFNSTIDASSSGAQEAFKSLKDRLQDDPGHGPYNENYVTLHSIGKGAFGFVKLAERISTKEPVVVKFIRKEKILRDSWIDDPALGQVPVEIYLLAKLDHPGIVKLHEAFENDDFFQMVMERHGDGIDLFEFIDRKPRMDEALASYMFRQVVAAVEYLHSQYIIHRDIKDENIIVDRRFQLKLIDFGSASFFKKGKFFSTFCGTVEYCSPEVLLGNCYQGPELEMWALGVTLYTFIFGEHPFFDIEETIRAELRPPFQVSNELMFLICWMLHAEVDFRARIKDLVTYPWLSRPVNLDRYNYDEVLAGDPEVRADGTESGRYTLSDGVKDGCQTARSSSSSEENLFKELGSKISVSESSEESYTTVSHSDSESDTDHDRTDSNRNNTYGKDIDEITPRSGVSLALGKSI